MAVQRVQSTPPRVVLSGIDGTDALYEVTLTAAPSREWRAAFTHPPPRLTSVRYTPDSGRIVIRGARLQFRARPDRLVPWLRRIDRWVRYANSVVAE
jgi:hypothetical protein